MGNRLKIKDEVDLKELEKYGFEKEIVMGEVAYICKFIKGLYIENLIVWGETRTIQASNCIGLLTVLYDLMQADLVEKIEGVGSNEPNQRKKK